jgi:hypothetical protein
MGATKSWGTIKDQKYGAVIGLALHLLVGCRRLGNWRDRNILLKFMFLVMKKGI